MTDFHSWISFTDPTTAGEAGIGVYPSDGGVRLVVSHQHDVETSEAEPESP